MDNSTLDFVNCNNPTDGGNRGEPWGARAPARGEQGGTLGGPSPLGNITGKVSTKFFDLDERTASRLGKYLTQNIISELLPKERVAWCLRMIVPSSDHVKVMFSAEVQRAHYKNLAVCGLPWVCPVCASKITERRRVELLKGLENWENKGGGVFMLVFTIKHGLNDRLGALNDVLGGGWRKIQQGRSWVEFKEKYGIVGHITAREYTLGLNGWHPHNHVLIFTDKKLSIRGKRNFEKIIAKRFSQAVEGMGGYSDLNIGCKLTDHESLGSYVAKWGLDYEITKASTKKAKGEGLNPFQIAMIAAAGDKNMVMAFREYHKETKGKKQLQYSHGLKKLLGIDEIEKTDLELATEQTEQAEVLAELSRDVWKFVVKSGKRGELLEVASRGNPDLLDEYIYKIILG